MPLDIGKVQEQLRTDGLDGWLLYDFHGQNAIAAKLAGLAGRHTTRRWFYFIPADGAPRKLVHAIEPGVLDELPGEAETYAGREELASRLRALLAGAPVVAMEYSPDNAVPYVSRVDAGTVEFIRGLGVRVVSSGDLVGRFEAAWNNEAIASHRAASEKLYRVKDRTFELLEARLGAREPLHEFEVQQTMAEWMQSEGLVTDALPIVAVDEHTANPHYSPTRDQSGRIGSGSLVLLDLWGKLDRPGAVYADITWMGYSGDAPAEIHTAFALVVAGRDAAVRLVQSRVEEGRPVRGWEVDRAARQVIADGGYGAAFIHRTGHSLGEGVHGNGVHMDDFETHDDRRLLEGTGFTIEPGIYTPAFGVRTEINVVVGARTVEVTGPRQHELVRIGVRT
ncbi:MAG: aminopeptidase P family protein [Acidobacteria bacterium]|nr:aminopeptidase P family protein [Acidobacteriota bacterium]